MCNHRTAGPWGRIWNTYLGVGLLIEVVGVLVGVPLTDHARRALGIDPRCGHEPYGRGVICLVGIWAVLHFGWGRFNFPLRNLLPKGCHVHRCSDPRRERHPSG